MRSRGMATDGLAAGNRMSGEQKIPRPAARLAASHVQPTQPFQVEDLPPDEVHEGPDSDPPVSMSEIPPTAAEERIRTDLAAGLSALRAEMRQGFLDVHTAMSTNTSLVRAEFVQLRKELGVVAARTLPQKVGSGVLKGSAGALIVTGGIAVLNMLANKWPELAAIAKWLNENANLFQ